MTEYPGLIVERDGACVRVTLDRAEQLNPLDAATIGALLALVRELEAAGEVRVVVLSGKGRAFSAGGDLKGYVALYRDEDGFRRFLEDFHALCAAIEASAKLYLCAVNGLTVAGGLELMLACDLVIATRSARIGDGHLNFAQLPGAGGSQRLPRAVGSVRARHLLFTGDLLAAEEAERIGLVGRVVDDDVFEAEIHATVAGLLEKSGAALAGAKHLLNRALEMDLAAGLAMERDFVHRHATREPDASEGLLAFAERRPPRYGTGEA